MSFWNSRRPRRTRPLPCLERLEDRTLLTVQPVTVTGPSWIGDSGQFGVSGRWGASNPSLSADGQLIVFASEANNLVPNDFNDASDVFLYDRGTGLVSLLSVERTGTRSGNWGSYSPKITPDGRFVLFSSDASDLTPEAILTGGGSHDLFVRDLTAGTTTLISVATSGTVGANGGVLSPSISDDGAVIAFASPASNLVVGDTNNQQDIFVRRWRDPSPVTQRVSTTLAGGQASASSADPVVSADGSTVVFTSTASLTPNDGNGIRDVYVVRLADGLPILVSVDRTGITGGHASSSLSLQPISADGRFVAFGSAASNLVTENLGGLENVFVRDLQANDGAGKTYLVSRDSTGTAGSDGGQPILTPDGRYVAWVGVQRDTQASDVVESSGRWSDVYRSDLSNLEAITTRLVSVNAAGNDGGLGNSGTAQYPYDFTYGALQMTPDGRYVAFTSEARDLAAGVTDGNQGQVFTRRRDVFVRDLGLNVTTQASVTPSGGRGGSSGSYSPVLNDPAQTNGRLIVAFESEAPDLTGAADANGQQDVFVRDLTASFTELASRRSPLLPATVVADAGGDLVAATPDGRFVAFLSWDTSQYVPHVTIPYGYHNLFVRDTLYGVNRIVTTLPGGTLTTGGSVYNVSLSADGRFVAFYSNKNNLDANASGFGVYLHDLHWGTTRLISRNPVTGAAPNAFHGSNAVVISPDGRYVAFTSSATNLVNGVGVPSGQFHLYLHDTVTGSLRLVSRSTNGTAGNGTTSATAYQPTFSADSRRLVYASKSSDLVAGVTDTNSTGDVFAYDLDGPNAFQNRLVSVSTIANTAGNADSGIGTTEGTFAPSISADGRYVAFGSLATNLTGQATSGRQQVFVRDLMLGTTTLVSFDQANTAGGNGHSFSPRISADGRRVLFESAATNISPTPGNASRQLHVRDLNTSTTQMVSVTTAGTAGNGTSGLLGTGITDRAALSPNGRYVAFNSRATDLVANFVSGGAGASWQLHVRDLQTGITDLVSVTHNGTAGGDDETSVSSAQSGMIFANDSGKGTFTSNASNLYVGDRNVTTDVFQYTFRGAGRIAGKVFRDDDSSGAPNGAEPGVGYWTVFLDTDGDRRLDPGEVTVQTDEAGNYAFTGLPGGTYSVVVALDHRFVRTTEAFLPATLGTATDSVGEKDFGVRPAPLDLVADAVTAPTEARPGQQVVVTYVARNVGDTSTTAAWQDAVYLSADQTLDAGDILLASLPRTGGLAAHGSYVGNAVVTIPATLRETFHVLVQVDRRLQVVSDTHRGNNIASASLPTTLSIPTLELGTPHQGTFTADLRDQYFQVTPQGGLPLSFTLDSAAADGLTEVYVGFGRLPSRSSFDFAAQATRPDQKRTIAMAQPGTYYVLVRGVAGQAASAAFTLTAAVPPLGLEGLSTNSGGNIGQVTVGIQGTRFSSATQFSLRAGAILLNAVAVQRVDASSAFVTFNLAGLQPRTFDVVATDGVATATLPGAFQVVPGVTNPYKIEMLLPEFVRPHHQRLSSMVLRYTNTSNVDVPAPLLRLMARVPLRLEEQSQLTGVYFPNIVPGHNELLILGTADEGPAGTLRPGQGGEVGVVFGTNVVPGIPFDFYANVFDPTGSQAVPWADIKAGMRPSTIPVDAWNPIFANFVAQAGSTTGDLVRLLGANATYLSSLGIVTRDVSRLIGMELSEADASLTGQVPVAVTDAVLATTGLSLSFQRTFHNTIGGRYTLGTLGRGWTHNWDMRVVADSGNHLLIQNGVARLFERDLTGGVSGLGYKAADPGDGGVLRLNPNDGSVEVFEADGTHLYFYHQNAGGGFYVEDRFGNRITATRDVNHLLRLTSLTHSNGASVTFDYSANGRLEKLTESTGRIVTYAYDASGEHLTGVTDGNGTTGYQYVTGQGAQREHALARVTSPAGRNLFFSYDIRGRVIREEGDGGANRITVGYDEFSRVTFTPAVGGPITIAYNDRGLRELVTDGLGRVTRFQYDRNGDITEVISPLGLRYGYESNGQGLVTGIIDPLGHTTHFTYDARLNLTRSTDALGRSTRYGYDPAGNLDSITYADGSRELIEHDALGNLSRTVNRRGQATSYQVDGRGRITQETFADGSSITYTYDGRDNRLTATDASGTTTYTYDPATDRLTRVAYPDGRSLEYTYDADGNRTRLKDQDGFLVNYVYDSAGRLREVTDAGNNRIAAYAYDVMGRVTRQDNGNGTATTYAHDAAGQLLSISHLAAGGAVRVRFAYTYDADGRRTSTTLTDGDPATPDGKTTYGYDPLGQLVLISMPDGRTIAYAYDAVGNRTRVVDSLLGTSDYEADAMNQITRAGDQSFAYDADGNLVWFNDGTNVTRYTYDSSNRLVAVVGPGGTFAYEYDVDGNRRAMTVDGVRTDYLIDPTQVLNVFAEYGAGGQAVHYVSGLGLLSRIDAGGAAAFYDFDATGNAVGLTDASGNHVNRYSYLPFGETTVVREAVSNLFQFVGQFGVRAGGDGLHLMKHRNYATATGQFTSPDPLGLGGFDSNIRRYVKNAPTSLVDPTGLTGHSLQQIASLVKKFQTLEQLGQWALADEALTAIGEIVLVGGAALGEVAVLLFGAGYFVGTVADYASLSPRQRFEIGKAIYDFFARHNKKKTLEQMEIDEANQITTVNQLQKVNASRRKRRGVNDLNAWTPGDPNDNPQVLNSIDPNDILGPAGIGAQQRVAVDSPMRYRIRFENQASATAPAQEVFVTMPLDPDLDWATFELGDFGWGDLTVDVPPGLQAYETRVSTTNLDGSPLAVDVTASLDRVTGIVTWTFRSLDPATGDFPTDPLAGFLPPDDETSRGDGFVDFVVRPKQGPTDDSVVSQQASIVFDTNAAIATNVHTNTIDRTPPVSAVVAPLVSLVANFPVSWAATDPVGVTGRYDVWVSIDGKPMTLWKKNLSSTSAVYPGVAGHRYGFAVVTADNFGNAQPVPTSVQTTVIVASASSLVLRRNGNDVQLINAATRAVLATRPIADPAPLLVQGRNGLADTLTIDFAVGGEFALAGGIRFDGGTGGGDRFNLVGAGTSTAVLVPGSIAGSETITVAGNAISLAGIEFQLVSALAGLTFQSAGLDDRVVVDRPSATQNRLWAVPLAPLTFFNVPTLTLDVGQGDTAASVNSVTVNGAWTAAGLATVKILGGTGSDTYTPNHPTLALPVPGGSHEFTGGTGTDTVIVAGNVSWTLTDTTLGSSAGGLVTLSGVEQGRLTGGLAANLLDASGFSGTTWLRGGGGSDILAGGSGFDWVLESGNVHFTLTNTRLTGLGIDTLTSIDGAILTGGIGNNRLDASAFTGKVQLDGGVGNDVLLGGSGDDTLLAGPGVNTLSGGGGTDTIAAAGNRSYTLANLRLTGPGIDLLTSVEAAILTGGVGNNTFNVTGWTGSATLDGGPGTDTLVSANDADFTLTNAGLIRSTGGTFNLTNFEIAQLTGGAGNNTLDATGFTGRASLDGGMGDDTLKAGDGPAVLIGGAGTDTLTAGFGRAVLIGGAGADTLTGGNGDDLLIHGSTVFDARLAALFAVLAEWSRTDRTYAQRVANLRNGTGLNGVNRLTVATVLDDLFSDGLTGGLGTDWMWARPLDLVNDRTSGEILN